MATKVKTETYVDIYDQYSSDDWKYNDQSSTNLNPRREVKPKKRDIYIEIQDRLQKITDDLVRKSIQRPEVSRKYRGAMGAGESIPMGMSPQRVAALMKTGSMSNQLLFPSISGSMTPSGLEKALEFLVGTFPTDDIDDLDLPPEIDCDQILAAYYGSNDVPEGDPQSPLDQFKDNNNIPGFENLGDDPFTSDEEEGEQQDGEDRDAGGEDDDDGGGDDGGGEEEGGGDSDDDYGEDDEIDEEEEEEPEDPEIYEEDLGDCPLIELKWLKILLVIIKIINAMKMIIDLALSIIMMILEVVMLAVGSWLNPTNIAKIIQFLIQLAISLILQLITYLIQLIWNWLHLDCLCDQTINLMNQLAMAFSAFATIANSFNPNAVRLLTSKFKANVVDPLEKIQKQLEENQEEWNQIKDQVSEIMTDPAAAQQAMDQVTGAIGDGVAQGLAGAVTEGTGGKLNQVVGSANNMIAQAGAAKAAIDSYNQSDPNSAASQATAQNSIPNVDDQIRGAIGSPQFTKIKIGTRYYDVSDGSGGNLFQENIIEEMKRTQKALKQNIKAATDAIGDQVESIGDSFEEIGEIASGPAVGYYD